MHLLTQKSCYVTSVAISKDIVDYMRINLLDIWLSTCLLVKVLKHKDSSHQAHLISGWMLDLLQVLAVSVKHYCLTDLELNISVPRNAFWKAC